METTDNAVSILYVTTICYNMGLIEMNAILYGSTVVIMLLPDILNH